MPASIRLNLQSVFASALLFSPLRQDVDFGSCTIGVDLANAVSIPFSGSQGQPTQSVQFQIAWQPELIGTVQYWQALSLSTGGPILGVATASNLLETTIGLDRSWD